MKKTSPISELALKLADERKKEADRQDRIAQEAAKALKKLYLELSQGVDAALEDIKKLRGVKVNGKTFSINGKTFEIKVEYETGTTRYSDESPEEDYQTYLIRWYDHNGACYGGHCSVNSFNEAFARHISNFL